MTLELQQTLTVSRSLVAFSLMMQTFEMFSIKNALSEHGVFAWSIIRYEFRNFPRFVSSTLDYLLDDWGFQRLLTGQMIFAILLPFYPHWSLSLSLLLSVILIGARFRGTFNGGSDYMTIVVLSALFVADLFKNSAAVSTASLWYVALQLTLSYFIAGMVKCRRAEWRNGDAIRVFLESSIFSSGLPERMVASTSWASGLAASIVIAFECAFPLALISQSLALPMLCIGAMFHLLNVYLFGLNRFFLAWLAAYPALIFCATISPL